jgi:hypothetical protein
MGSKRIVRPIRQEQGAIRSKLVVRCRLTAKSASRIDRDLANPETPIRRRSTHELAVSVLARPVEADVPDQTVPTHDSLPVFPIPDANVNDRLVPNWHGVAIDPMHRGLSA